MIHVQHLTKSYGDVRAIGDIGFAVDAGEVVGLLGPNGAGKTTTMRILCGCIGASSGTVTINGIDLNENPTAAKAHIGYLPERPPLYDEMSVGDFVAFSAAIQGVANVEESVANALQQVGLDGELGGTPIRDRIIARLSKGYRQRVGLAAALVHNPSILILDEPTSGLDPAQRKELRTLLASLAREGRRTVMVSTHILGEIEAVCDRVIVINNGALVAQDTIENLRPDASIVRLRVAQEAAALGEELEAIDGVASARAEADGWWTVSMNRDCRTEIAACAASHGLLELRRMDGLEDIYLRLIQETA
ncbi:MAG: ABC transporter ATP-binding protein [Myxococcota bacterium]|nr:ABC transporter ATP-binding protein [Myxococcota bacterium]